MSAEWGDLKEPTAYVPPDDQEASGTQLRADRYLETAPDSTLGRWGSEPWRMPGKGDSGPMCGQWQVSAVCSDCGDADLTQHRCGRRSCPDCWSNWAAKAAVRATRRIQAFRYTQPKNHRRQAAHAVVAPPEGAVRSEKQYWDGRSKAAEIAEAKGWRGFCIIPHPWRPTEEAKKLYRASDPDYGIWVFIRNDLEDPSAYREWSPHYHIIGMTGADMDPAEEGDEWNYKFIRSMEAMESIRDKESHEDLYGAFRYLLSHTGYPEESSKQVTTWYGQLANSVFVEEATEDWQHQKPSEGVVSALQREIEEVAGVAAEDDEDEASAEHSDDLGECPDEECDGVLIDVFDVRLYLEANEPPPGVADRMLTALEWRLGERQPPPGLKHPRTAEEAREAFQAMLPAE